MHITVNGGPIISWQQFVEENNGLSADELSAMLTCLERDGSYSGGGGAAAEFVLKRAFRRNGGPNQ